MLPNKTNPKSRSSCKRCAASPWACLLCVSRAFFFTHSLRKPRCEEDTHATTSPHQTQPEGEGGRQDGLPGVRAGRHSSPVYSSQQSIILSNVGVSVEQRNCARSNDGAGTISSEAAADELNMSSLLDHSLPQHHPCPSTSLIFVLP